MIACRYGYLQTKIFWRQISKSNYDKIEHLGQDLEEKNQPQPLRGIMEPYFRVLKEIQNFILISDKF